MTDIFISYSRKDLAVATNLAKSLDDLGYVVWWDRRNLRGGQAFAREIERVIRRASCVIVIWSQASVKSEWVYAEASLAYQQGNLLTAVYNEADIPLPFNTRHNEDLSHWRGDLRHAGLQKLLQSVGRCHTLAVSQNDVEQQRQAVVLPQQPKSGFAWSSTISASLGALSLAMAGSAFYWLMDTQVIHEPAASVDKRQIRSPKSTVASKSVEPFQSASLSAESSLPFTSNANSKKQSSIVLNSSAGEVPLLKTKQQPPSIEPVMVEIPAGSFVPVCTSDARAFDMVCGGDAQQPIKVDGFWMGETEVSVAQFRRFVAQTDYKTTAEVQGWCWGGRNGSNEWERVEHSMWRQPGLPQQDNHPVVCVSWDDAQAFVQWLSRETGKLYTLPTEEQWEYAALGGHQRQAEGSVTSNCKYANIADQAAGKRYPEWRVSDCDDGYIYSSPVGKFSANGYDLHDMQGNVWEWTLGFLKDRSAIQVIRGSSWGYDPRIVRSSARVIWEKNYPSQDIGFRLVETRD